MFTDFHSHILPGMDDGAKSLAVSQQMIQLLHRQGVGRIVVTPHFYGQKESIETFLNRRSQCLHKLQEHSEQLPEMEYRLGAEVYLLKGLSQHEGLEQLCWGGTNYLLIEMPYEPLKDWMLAEVDNIACNFSVTPVFAHVDRYLKWYRKKDYEQLFSANEAIFQINNDALFNWSSLKFARNLIQGQMPVIFGSDCHNLTTRAPNFEQAQEVLQKKLKESVYADLMEWCNGLL